MLFTKRLREPVKNGEITKSVRIWKSPRVKVGNAYPLAPGYIVVDAIQSITLADITQQLARDTGFSSVAELLSTAKHGKGEQVYLVSFHYTTDLITE